MSTQSCATHDILARWLQGDMESSAIRDLDEHVETCGDCQVTLERLTLCRLSQLTDAPLTDALKRIARTPQLYSLPASRQHDVAETVLAMNPSNDRRPRIPGYEVLRLLGRGGMGRVFLAHHAGLDRLVAVKVLVMDLAHNTQFVSRLRAEAKSLAALKHPNVLQVFDVVDTDGLPALILEYVEKGNLSQMCDTQRPSPAEACRIVEHIARGVHAAHQKGIIHRDLKPTNILMDGLIPIITDFGLAMNNSTGDRLTAPGDLFGTPEYMAPELIRDGVQSSSPQSDIYALGAILYELLTGKPPFSGKTAFQTMELVSNTLPVPPKAHAQDVPDELNRICLRALEKLPEKRFSSALEMADELAGAATSSGSIATFASAGATSNRNQESEQNRTANHSHSLRIALLSIVAVIVTSSLAWWIITEVWQTGVDEQVNVSTGKPQDIFPAGSLWQGTFKFLPASNEQPDGDMEVEIESRTGEDFEGIYYSEQRHFAWKIRGVIRGNEVWWSFVSAIRDNNAGSVVGRVQVAGTIAVDRMTATWTQKDEMARLDFIRIR